jgi:hypothetical protein
MRNLTLTLTLAAAAALAAPALNPAQAQWDVIRRRTEGVITGGSGVYDRDGVYRNDGVYDSRTASRVPPGHLPPRGMCRVWVDGVAPGQQPPVTDCATAERERYRYGSQARVLYGDQQSRPGRANGKYKNRSSDSYGVYDTRSRTYDTVINGRNCRVTEWWDGTRTQRRTSCDDGTGVLGRRTTRTSNTTYGRVYSDDDSDARGGKKFKAAKQKGGKGKGKGHGK